MSTTGIVILVVAIVVGVLLIAAVVAALRARQRNSLRERYGSEYDRTVADADSRRQAERELRERTERREQLDIRPLDPLAAQRYRDEWRVVQERFVDSPAEAVAQAHGLVSAVLRDRGYPTTDEDERMSMLSVDHADVLDHYRSGMRTEQSWRDSGRADTEDLRVAMQHYREVFDRLVAETDDAETDDDEAYPDGARTTTRTTRGTSVDRT
jgi:hypothetical protein